MRTISLKLPEALITQLAIQAKSRQVSKSMLIRESLEETLRSQPTSASCFDLAHDLAGSIKGAPAGLAHEPSYMEGFGQEDRRGNKRPKPRKPKK